jgi:hypothetical protein
VTDYQRVVLVFCGYARSLCSGVRTENIRKTLGRKYTYGDFSPNAGIERVAPRIARKGKRRLGDAQCHRYLVK